MPPRVLTACPIADAETCAHFDPTLGSGAPTDGCSVEKYSDMGAGHG